jgi:threonine/homoserine/homoserine lactone efflux protein
MGAVGNTRLVAMGLVWQYADVCGNQKWKGLTWGMLPLHTSGICACTYHLFYNSHNVESLVALQALLTLIGNFTLWWAAYRIFQSTQEEEEGEGEEEGETPLVPGVC